MDKIEKEHCIKQKNLENTLAEVRSLAKLNHPNVIRYHTSWIERDKDFSLSKNNNIN